MSTPERWTIARAIHGKYSADSPGPWVVWSADAEVPTDRWETMELVAVAALVEARTQEREKIADELLSGMVRNRFPNGSNPTGNILAMVSEWVRSGGPEPREGER